MLICHIRFFLSHLFRKSMHVTTCGWNSIIFNAGYNPDVLFVLSSDDRELSYFQLFVITNTATMNILLMYPNAHVLKFFLRMAYWFSRCNLFINLYWMLPNCIPR